MINYEEEVLPFLFFKDDLEKYYNGEIANSGLCTNWPLLNNYYRPAPGTLNIITGIPSHGKSSFMDSLMIQLTQLHNTKWGIFSPENYPTYLHIQKLIELESGRPFFSPYEDLRLTPVQMEISYKKLCNNFFFFNPPESSLNLKRILDLSADSIETENINAVVIDPWNELNSAREDGQNESDYIGSALALCRRFARKHNILFFILAHPAKMYKKPDATKYDVPTLYNISGSANWYNKADNGITVYRNFEKDAESVDIHIQKIKFKSHGKIGAIKMSYDFFNGRFNEICEAE